MPVLVVMGVSGSGKSTLAKALAARLGATFIEGDEHHPAANIEKMADGIKLQDEDRWPYLANVAAAVKRHAAGGAVASCSALKRSYRDFLSRRVGQEILFIVPLLTREQLAERMRQRSGHFMPVALLDSQLATFEPPQEDEPHLVLDGAASVSRQIDRIVRWIGRRAATPD